MDHLATTSGLHAQNLTGNDIILREIGAMGVQKIFQVNILVWHVLKQYFIAYFNGRAL